MRVNPGRTLISTRTVFGGQVATARLSPWQRWSVEWQGSGVRMYAQALLALLVTCHLSLKRGRASVSMQGWMQTNKRADAACLPAAGGPQAGLKIDPARLSPDAPAAFSRHTGRRRSVVE